MTTYDHECWECHYSWISEEVDEPCSECGETANIDTDIINGEI
jgi:hypothetical protein